MEKPLGGAVVLLSLGFQLFYAFLQVSNFLLSPIKFTSVAL
jgi:hypothetical protein